MIKEHHPEVVLTDLKMPGKNGLKLVEEIAHLRISPEVVVMTAFSSVKTTIKAIRLGAYDYLTKPLEPEEVLFLIEKAQEALLQAKIRGNTPAMVVIEVRKIGCIRATPPSIIASINSMPFLIFLFILSISTMASLTTIPDKETIPIKAVNEKG